MCMKQTAVSHSSTESEIISLDAGLRMDGLLTLDLLDMVIEALRSTNNTTRQGKRAHGDLYGTGEHSISKKSKLKPQLKKRKRDVEQLSTVDYILTNTHSSQGESQLYIFKDNEAVIKMIIKGRSLTMRHVSRTHRVALDWLFERINLEPKIQIKYVDTKNQLADMLTKGSFSRDEWNLRRLFNIRNFSLYYCSHFSEFFLTIRLESRAPCQKEVRRRLRTKALQRRKRDHVWWRASKGVRKSLHEVWDLWSIRWIPMKEKKSE